MLGGLVFGGLGRAVTPGKAGVVGIVDSDRHVETIAEVGPPKTEVVGDGDLVVPAALEVSIGLASFVARAAGS
jgi:hypothetical protein